jgi:hypothetical protein
LIEDPVDDLEAALGVEVFDSDAFGSATFGVGDEALDEARDEALDEAFDSDLNTSFFNCDNSSTRLLRISSCLSIVI